MSAMNPVERFFYKVCEKYLAYLMRRKFYVIAVLKYFVHNFSRRDKRAQVAVIQFSNGEWTIISGKGFDIKIVEEGLTETANTATLNVSINKNGNQTSSIVSDK